MRVRVLFTLLGLLLLAVALGWALQQFSGEVAFMYRGWTVRLSVITFVVVMVLLFGLVHILLRALGKLLRLPAELRRRSASRRRRQAERHLDQSVSAILEGDWAGAVRLALECRRHDRSAPPSRAQQLTSCLELLRRTGAEPGSSALEAAWRALPNKLKKENVLLAAYVRERLRHGDERGCEPLLRRGLKRRWDEELINLFGLVRGRNAKAQLEFAERLLPQRPGNAALLLALGRLCMENQLWGKARNYLEQSVRIRPEPTSCRELAALLEQQGDHVSARKYLQQGLDLATRANPWDGGLPALHEGRLPSIPG